MLKGFIPSTIIYIIMYWTSKKVTLYNKKMKYFILFSIIMVFTISGVFITYHAVLVALLPFLYATIYSSKAMIRYVYFLTVISTIVVVYGVCVYMWKYFENSKWKY
ncbi:MAG: hypothetical protein IJA34_08510 [Lachnospiraceae bacterium]|nr:hypothetical protein [Lachnospiraceae bacterium]